MARLIFKEEKGDRNVDESKQCSGTTGRSPCDNVVNSSDKDTSIVMFCVPAIAMDKSNNNNKKGSVKPFKSYDHPSTGFESKVAKLASKFNAITTVESEKAAPAKQTSGEKAMKNGANGGERVYHDQTVVNNSSRVTSCVRNAIQIFEKDSSPKSAATNTTSNNNNKPLKKVNGGTITNERIFFEKKKLTHFEKLPLLSTCDYKKEGRGGGGEDNFSNTAVAKLEEAAEGGTPSHSKHSRWTRSLSSLRSSSNDTRTSNEDIYASPGYSSLVFANKPRPLSLAKDFALESILNGDSIFGSAAAEYANSAATIGDAGDLPFRSNCAQVQPAVIRKNNSFLHNGLKRSTVVSQTTVDDENNERCFSILEEEDRDRTRAKEASSSLHNEYEDLHFGYNDGSRVKSCYVENVIAIAAASDAADSGRAHRRLNEIDDRNNSTLPNRWSGDFENSQNHCYQYIEHGNLSEHSTDTYDAVVYAQILDDSEVKNYETVCYANNYAAAAPDFDNTAEDNASVVENMAASIATATTLSFAGLFNMSKGGSTAGGSSSTIRSDSDSSTEQANSLYGTKSSSTRNLIISSAKYLTNFGGECTSSSDGGKFRQAISLLLRASFSLFPLAPRTTTSKPYVRPCKTL